MKMIVFLVTLLITFSAGAEIQRKVSSSSDYVCIIERDAGDRKDYRREYRFPFPLEGESYELKGSLRFNKYSLIFARGQNVKISFTEAFGKDLITSSDEVALEGSTKTLRRTLELRQGIKTAQYHIDCRPE